MTDAAVDVARASYGRLVAILAARSGDIVAAEDALADAFVAALETWPRDGVPRSPDAWLLAAAKRRIVDAHRRDKTRERSQAHIVRAMEDLVPADQGTELPDERLRLLFVCTHPAIAHDVQVPLMLQVVLGLDAARIASAMCVAPKTMGQRLWRAKIKIREAGISFSVPGRDELPERLSSVLEAIYAAFGTGWDDVTGADPSMRDLRSEAIFLCRLLVKLAPHEAEAQGLLALMLFAESRRDARRASDGSFVPLDSQDTERWSFAAIREAEALLSGAFRLGVLGPYQLEAAIQSAHVNGVRSGRHDREAVARLYDGLVAMAPSLGAEVSRAAAVLAAYGSRAAMASLSAIAFEERERYQPYWVVRAEALAEGGERDLSLAAFERAIGLTEDPATRDHLVRRVEAIRRQIVD